jgi:hypothetical protein
LPKPKVHDDRYDFRQGRNSAVSPDLLNASELVDATNVRIDTSYGGFTKRTGTRRLHAAAIGSGNPVTGLLQWDWSGGKQVVAIANGNLYHKTSALGAFTQVVPGTLFSTSKRQSLQPFRSVTSGAALVLYVAGDGYYKWTGAALSLLTPTGLPTDADILAAHATRMFARSASYPKVLYWSKVGDAETWQATGLPTDAGTAPVNVMTGESINSLEIVGMSLLIGSEDSISRFSGSNTDNIQLATDTVGLSTEIGAVGINALKKFETAAAAIAERGPHVVTESGLVPIGLKIEPDFLNITPAVLANAAIGYHRGRKEIWFAIPGTNDGGVNKTVYVYSTRLQAWMGPWTYSFGITSFARYEDSNGAENLIAGCTDGFVRLMDDVGSYLDDRLSDGTGGSAITMTAEVAPHFWAPGPGSLKTVFRLQLDADLNGASLSTKHSFDGSAFTTTAVASSGSGVLPYRVDLDGQGKRMRLQFVDSSSGAPAIYGYALWAFDMQRMT